MEIKKINLEDLGKKLISKTTNIIKNGGVVVVPTDTVYGLMCDAANKEAVGNIYKIKKRDPDKPIGIFIGDKRMARKYVKIEKDQEYFLETADTYVFFSRKNVSLKKTLGIRLSKSELVLKLIDKLGLPLAQTSANISGQSSTNNIKEIINAFKGQKVKPDLILDAGNLPEKKASKVIDLTGKESKIIRN
jgi:L-threonylcarbamoyladenylate synthase